jgi:hypothetical protein
MASYYLLSLLLYRVLPGQEVYGTKLRESGKPLKYKLNGKRITNKQNKCLSLINSLKRFLLVWFNWLHAP